MLKNFTKTILFGVMISSFVFWSGLKNHPSIMVAQAQDSGSSDSSDSGSYSPGDSGGYDNSGDSYDNSSGGDSSGNYNPFTNSYDNYSSGDGNSSGYDDSSSGNSDNNSNEIIVLPGNSYDNSSYSNYDNSNYDGNSSGYDNSSDSTSGTNDASSWDYYDDSSYSSYGNSNDNSSSGVNSSGYDNSGSSVDSYNSNDPNSDFVPADEQYNYSDASRSQAVADSRSNDKTIADKLGWESFTATEATGNGGDYATKNNGQTLTGKISEREYNASDMPSLDEGQVLVGGASTKVTDQSGQKQGGNIDTYYIADKNNLPDDYILSPASSLTSSDGEYQPVMVAQDKATALKEDAKADQNGDFSYASVVDPKLNNLGIDQIGKDSKLSQEFLSVNSAMSKQIEPYNENSGEILSDFKDYGAKLPSNESQADKEKDIYNYVNNNIKAADPNSTSYDSGHSLADAVSCGIGVCADKAVALVTTLNAAGIPAAQVDAPNHTFVAVLKSGTTNGSVDHYLDPMYFETYLPLQRPSVKAYQLVK